MIHINIGSNLNSTHGSKFDNITIAIKLLADSKVTINKISKFYETPSYPNQNFPKFLNIGILCNCDFSHSNLLKKIGLIEKKIGRVKSKKNNPRIIDIDIIDYRGIIHDSNDLILPHPKSHLRNFVLYPILEIDPNWSHPVFKKNVEYLIKKLSQKSRIEITRLQKNVNIDV